MRVRLEQDGARDPARRRAVRPRRRGRRPSGRRPRCRACWPRCTWRRRRGARPDKVAGHARQPAQRPHRQAGAHLHRLADPQRPSSARTADASASSCRASRKATLSSSTCTTPEVAFADMAALPLRLPAAHRPQPGRFPSSALHAARLRPGRPQRVQRAGQRRDCSLTVVDTDLASRSAPASRVFRCEVGKPEYIAPGEFRGPTSSGSTGRRSRTILARWPC